MKRTLDTGALEMREVLRRGETSSTELVTEALARIEAAQHPADGPGLGAFIHVEPELALAEAAEADRILAARAPDAARPPLLGLPTAHKDLVPVRGFPTTHGSAAVPHARASLDDPVAAVIRSAGAVTLGKTQVPEFGIAAYSENGIASPARNPHDLQRTAGGSSGGTAAAITAGVIPAAIASDAGGSIRIPAAACGLVGLKPGRAAVPADLPREPGANRLTDELGAPSLAVSGPIARNARDAALFYDALIGRRDEPTLAAVDAAIRRPKSLAGLRIGVSLSSPFEGWAAIEFDADALAALDAGARALEAAGHRVEHAEFAYDEAYPEAFTDVWTAGLARIGLDPEAEGRLGELAGMFLKRSRNTSIERLHSAAETLRAFAADASRQWGGYDAVLTPALAFTAPAVGAFQRLGPEGDYRLQCEWAPQTSMVNVAGLPAVVAPTSTDAHGLPRGVQLIGRAGAEALLLQLVAQIDAALAG